MTDPMNSWAQPEGGAPATPPAPTPLVAPPTATPLAAPPVKGSGRATNILLGVALLVAVGGLAFAGGRVTAPAGASGFPGGRAGFPTGSFDPNQAGGFDPNRAGGFAPGGDRALTITGTVKSLDGSTLVLTAGDGTEMTIDVSGSTYHTETAATASDVTSGSSVSVTVTGFGGFRGPNASAAPNGGAGSTSIKASDVIITGK
jgi:hypothetical protein